MNIVLPSVQVFILVVFSSLFSLFVNGIRTDGIPLLAKELDEIIALGFAKFPMIFINFIFIL